MTHLDIVRDLTQAQTITVYVRGLDFTQPPAAEFEIEIQPEEEEVTTFNTSVAASSDDAQQTSSTVTLADTVIGVYGTTYYNGLRFQNVTVPKGATITNAYITVLVTTNDDPTLDIYAEDVDDATTFTTASNDISGRTRTTAKTNWTATNIGTWGNKNSPDIKSVIQEITDRSGWSSGNDLNIILVGLSGSNFSYTTWDAGSNYPAITIDYTTSSSGANPKTARIRLTTKVGGTLTR